MKENIIFVFCLLSRGKGNVRDTTAKDSVLVYRVEADRWSTAYEKLAAQTKGKFYCGVVGMSFCPDSYSTPEKLEKRIDDFIARSTHCFLVTL